MLKSVRYRTVHLKFNHVLDKKDLLDIVRVYIPIRRYKKLGFLFIALFKMTKLLLSEEAQW